MLNLFATAILGKSNFRLAHDSFTIMEECSSHF
jgi:hypothetical protein